MCSITFFFAQWDSGHVRAWEAANLPESHSQSLNGLYFNQHFFFPVEAGQRANNQIKFTCQRTKNAAAVLHANIKVSHSTLLWQGSNEKKTDGCSQNAKIMLLSE